MHSEPPVESRATGRGRRRKQGNGSAAGPVFVDSTGRRSKVLRRVGTLAGVACLAYAGVLGAAQGDRAPGGLRPQGGAGRQAVLPSGTPSAPPAGATAPSASPSVSASVSADADTDTN